MKHLTLSSYFTREQVNYGTLHTGDRLAEFRTKPLFHPGVALIIDG